MIRRASIVAPLEMFNATIVDFLQPVPRPAKTSGIDARGWVLWSLWSSCLFTTIRKERLMTRAATKLLDNGEPLPALTMNTVAHGQLSLPDAFGDGWGVLLLYRAHW
jgi:hypothetical protein